MKEGYMVKIAEKKDTSSSLINISDNSTKHGGNAVYGLGFVGSLIYYIQTSNTFWMGIAGFFKALVWTAIVVYKVLESFYG